MENLFFIWFSCVCFNEFLSVVISLLLIFTKGGEFQIFNSYFLSNFNAVFLGGKMTIFMDYKKNCILFRKGAQIQKFLIFGR